MTTLLDLRTDLRDHLDEVTARQWSNAELNRWINEACRDIGRRAENIQEKSTSILLTAGTQEYAVPSDVFRIHRAEFVPSGASPQGSEVYPLQMTTLDELDSVWGLIQNTMQSYPSYAAFWGYPPNLKMRLFPVPSQEGSLYLYYFRVPREMTADTDVAEIPYGWQDVIVLYAEYVARRKDRDPLWQEAKTLYEERLAEMIDTTRQWHDQSQVISVGTTAVPNWLYSFDY